MSFLKYIPGHKYLFGLGAAAVFGPALPAIAIGASVLGTAVSAVGAIQGSMQQSAQAKYQSRVAKNNRILAERYAADAEERGRVAELNQRTATKRLQGRQRAVLAANGVLVDQGSAADIGADTAMLGEVDALTIRNNAAREALGFRAQGMNFEAESRLYKSTARNAKAALPFQIGGLVLDGASSVASKWYNFKNTGVTS